jgi:lysozyme
VAAQTTSQKGLAFIAAFEGYRSLLYDDAAGYATIGIGHLVAYKRVHDLTDAERAPWAKGLMYQQALDLLHKDVANFEIAVREAVKPPLTQAQFDALVSFAYNCGGAAVRGSVGRAVNAKPKRWNVLALRRWRRSVCAALLQWDHAGGVELAGLKRRRECEGRLFSTGNYATS